MLLHGQQFSSRNVNVSDCLAGIAVFLFLLLSCALKEFNEN